VCKSLLALVGILAITNLGTSLAAAYIARGTIASPDGELTDRHTREALSTQTSTESIEFERTVTAPGGGRRLCTAGMVDVDDNCEAKSLLTVGSAMCENMISHCSRGNTVDLKRTWKNGDVSYFNTCRVFFCA
jgi:hypothetical protein